jgi:hypothetical protein
MAGISFVDILKFEKINRYYECSGLLIVYHERGVIMYVKY